MWARLSRSAVCVLGGSCEIIKNMTTEWDWTHYIGMMDWFDLYPDYPGWELENGKPLYVDLTITNKKDKSSHKIASEWDEIATGPFYWRDWTDSGLPFADEGEVYRSAFWFALRSDMEKFKQLYLKNSAI